MINRRLVLSGAGAGLARVLLGQTRTQTPAQPLVFEHDLPDLTMHNWEVRATEIRYEPGGTSSAHRHPGITLVYVLEGEIESQVDGGPVQTYSPGQMFLETPNQLHQVSRNASKTKPARFLAILLTEKGVPLVKPA
jgi:quercetin dioxygenase-like cupin family protein